MFVIDFPEHFVDCPIISYCSEFKKKIKKLFGQAHTIFHLSYLAPTTTA